MLLSAAVDHVPTSGRELWRDRARKRVRGPLHTVSGGWLSDHIMAQKIHVTVAVRDLGLGSSRKPSIRVWIRSPRFESHLLLYPPSPLGDQLLELKGLEVNYLNSACNRLPILSLHMEEKWTNCVQCKKRPA